MATSITNTSVTTDNLTVDTNVLHVDSTNNRVGIGTSSPSKPLHVSLPTGSGATPRATAVAVIDGNDNTQLDILGGASSILGINFGDSGDNDQARITCNTTPGSEDMAFTVNADIRMKINANGQITKPNQPACFVYKGGNGNSASDSGAGALDTVGVNNGNHFNTATGRFTCPVAGMYMVCWTMMNNQNNTGTSVCVMRVNGSGYKYFHVENSHPQGQSDQLIYNANANDYFDISLTHYHWNGGSQYKYPSMTVFLIG